MTCILHSSIASATVNSALVGLMQFVARFNILVLKLLWQQEEED